MSGELIGILSVGVALAAIMLTSIKSLREDMQRMEGRLDKRMDGLENQIDGLGKRMDRLENRMDGLEKRMDGLDNRMGGLEKRHGWPG